MMIEILGVKNLK